MKNSPVPFARSYCVDERLGEPRLDIRERLVRLQRDWKDSRVRRDAQESEYADPRQADLNGPAKRFLEPFA